jgi:hypothetical protein
VGLISSFLTPVILVLNLVQLQRARRLPPATDRMGPALRAGPRLSEQPGLWIALVLVPPILLFVLFRH